MKSIWTNIQEGQPETLSMPTDDGLGLDNVKGFSPIRPGSRQDHPKQPICVCQPRSRMAMFQNRQLLAQDQILSCQRPMGMQR
jgi:hypothetical protein